MQSTERKKNTAVESKSKVSLRICLIALGLIILIFSTYEIIEHLWLAEVDMELLHLFHIIRGVATSLVVALIVGWYILKNSPSIFPSMSAQAVGLPKEEVQIEERHTHFRLWFIQMRWLACITTAVLTIMIVHVLKYLEKESFGPLIGLIACLTLTNIFYSYCLRRGYLIRQMAEIGIYTDLIILTAMLHFSGGIENPLSFTYIFHIIIGGILLNRRKCYTIVVVASGFITILAFAELTEVIKHYTLLIFPHPHINETEHLFHAAHEPVFVSSMMILEFVLLFLTGYFTTTIMERLRAEENQVMAERQRLERVVQASGAGFAIFDRELQPVWLNDQIKAWLHLSAQINDQDRAVLADWIDSEERAAALTLRDGSMRVVERELLDEQGDRRFFQVTVAPLLDNLGKVYQVVELTQDITQRKMVEAEMLHSAKMTALGFMAAGIAHEVGNPLASISTRLRLLKDKHDEAFLDESLDLLGDQISRISRILHGVSQFARKPKNGWNICRIDEIVNETVKLLRFHRLAENRQMETQLAATLPETTGVRDQLIQVFLNLGLNSMESMSDGGALTIKTYDDGHNIYIKFTDTGKGMSEEIREKLFTPFFSTKKDGLGLGLCIVHNIVNAHGGRIDVASRPGHGSVFTVILPIRAHKDLAGTRQQETD